MKRISVLIVMLLYAFVLHAQELLKPKMELRIDSVGNAQIKVSMSLNANQWQVWTQSIGNNPALLKRNMERELPGYFLDNFNLVKNDMERSFVFTFKAYGVCMVNKKGIWIVGTDQKNPDITKISDRKYMMVSTDVMNNLQQTQIIEFPLSAINIREAKDAYNKTQFEFEMGVPPTGLSMIFWIGVLLTALGGGLIIAIKSVMK